MNNLEVIGLGALNMDYLYKVERTLVDGETVVEEAKSSPGGSAANTIYSLAKLGVNTGFAGVVGDDAEGRMLVQDFQKVEVDVSQIRVKPKIKTGSVLCLSDRLGRRSLYVIPSANSLLTMDDLDLTYINRATMLHLSSFADDRQLEISVELLKRLDSSVKVSFAPGALYATKGIKRLSPILDRTYILFVNQSEIEQLTGEDVVSGAETCLSQGCRIVVSTLGRGIELELTRGISQKKVIASCYIRDSEVEYAVESISQNTALEADTTGAGDAFASGFLYGLLKEKGLEECGRLGNIVAQFSISKMGSRLGLPTSAELAQRYQELYSG